MINRLKIISPILMTTFVKPGTYNTGLALVSARDDNVDLAYLH